MPRFTLNIIVSKERPAELVIAELERDGIIALVEKMNTAKSVILRGDGSIILEGIEDDIHDAATG